MSAQTESSEESDEECGEWQDPHQLRLELNSACKADDLPRIRQLLTTTSLERSDANLVFTSSLSISVLRCLLEHGANADFIGSRKRELALDVLRLLAEFGFDVKAKGHLILQDFADSQETLDWILDQGADINDSDHGRLDDGFRLAGKDYSVKVLSNVAARGDIELFDHLVSRGADPHRSLALHAVSRCRDVEKSKAMIDHLLDKHGMNIETDSIDLMKIMYLPDAGTPLHYAVFCKNTDTLKNLLTRGANPTFAIGCAISDGLYETYPPAIAPLLGAGYDATDALERAVKAKSVEAAQICLSHGADPTSAIEMLRAHDARVQARRKPGSEADPEQTEDSQSSNDDEEDEEEVEQRAQLKCLLESADRMTRHL